MWINRSINYLISNKILLFIIIAFGFALKFVFFPIRLGDYNYYLEPWINNIAANGYFKALKYDFYNYTPAYMYILTLIAYTKLYPLYLIKLVSILFEYLIALYIGKIIFLKYGKKEVIFLSLAFIPLIPTVLLNGAYWGQCDAIYSAFVIMSVYYILKEKPFLSILLLGCAFCFKMQAVFVLPFYFVLMLRGHVKWYCFLLIPFVYFLSVIPVWLMGRDIVDLLTIYIDQSNYEKALTVFFPNMYVWIDDKYFFIVKNIGYLLTFSVTLTVGLLLKNKKIVFNFEQWIFLLYLSVIVAPFILPGMRERYLFLADISSLLFIVLIRKNLYIPLGMLFVSFYAYLSCSRLQTILILEPVFFVYLFIIVMAIIQFIKSISSTHEHKKVV